MPRLIPGICIRRWTLLAAAILVACGGDNPLQTSAGEAPVLTSISIDLSAASIEVGQKAAAGASGIDQYGRPISLGAVSWSTTNEGVITITSAGVVTGIAPGSAAVVANSGGRQASKSITVTTAPTGTLQVTVTGLPAGSNGAVTVTGPNGFSQLVTALRTFSSIPLGTYSVVGSAVAASTTTYDPAPAAQSLSVTAGAIPIATVAYAPRAPRVVVSPAASVRFVGDTVQVKALIVDAQGIESPAVGTTWSSDQPAVVTIDNPGIARARAVGAAAITATSQGIAGTSRIAVTPLPASRTDLDAHYPFVRTIGPISVSADIGQVFADSEAANLSRTWTYFTQFFGPTGGASFHAYYTLDSSLYVKTFPFCPGSVWYPQSRQTSACYNGTWSEYYVPMTLPDYLTQLHEVSHLFLYGLHPDAENFPWFKEGSGMYFESGSFNAPGAFVDALPLPYLRSGIRAYRNSLIPLDTLVRLSRNRFYGAVETGDVAFTVKSYSEAGMFFSYLMRQYPGTMADLFASFRAGLNRTNDEVIQYIINKTGLSIAELESRYLAYAATLPP